MAHKLRTLLILIGVLLAASFAIRFFTHLRFVSLEKFYELKTSLVSFSSALLATSSAWVVFRKNPDAYLYCCFLTALSTFDSIENYYFYSTYGYGRINAYLYLAALSFFAFSISVYLQFLDKKKAGV